MIILRSTVLHVKNGSKIFCSNFIFTIHILKKYEPQSETLCFSASFLLYINSTIDWQPTIHGFACIWVFMYPSYSCIENIGPSPWNIIRGDFTQRYWVWGLAVVDTLTLPSTFFSRYHIPFCIRYCIHVMFCRSSSANCLWNLFALLKLLLFCIKPKLIHYLMNFTTEESLHYTNPLY